MRQKNKNPSKIETHGPYSPGIVKGDYLVIITGNPFVHIDDRLLGPAEGPRLIFDLEPTREEFKAGNVRLPIEILKRVDNLLMSDREALIIGKAASGKTTLAFGYGLSHEVNGGLALYLDCKEYMENLNIGIIRNFVETNQSNRLLLIIDNIHLIPERFELLRRTLRNLQVPEGKNPKTDTFSVLYLGRKTQQYNIEKIRAIERMEAGGKTIHLHADRSSFHSVYTRLVLREKINFNNLSPKMLDKWVNDFAEDLVSFAVAVQSSCQNISDSKFYHKITPQIALENIRHRYLKPLSKEPEAYWNLLLLCAFSELELVADSEIFNQVTPVSSPFEKLLNEGIVYARKVGEDIKYDLFHPSLASLILKADPSQRSWASILQNACYRRPNAIVHILMRLYDIGMFHEAREMELILKKPEFFSLCITTLKPHEWHKLFRSLTKSSPDLFLFIEKEIYKDTHLKKFVEQIVTSPPQFISSFIRYLDKESPDLSKAIKEGLIRKENQNVLLRNILDRPLSDLSLFFSYAEEGMPDVASAISKSLSQTQFKEDILKKILDSELHFIGRFIDYVERNMRDVLAYLIENLSKPNNKELLLTKSIQIQPHLLVEFFKYLDKSGLNEVGQYIKVRLNQHNYMDELALQILSTGLGHWKIFFDYATNEMPDIADNLKNNLVKEEYSNKILNRALETPLHELGNFLKYAKVNIEKLICVLDKGLSSEEYRYSLLDNALGTNLHLLTSFMLSARDNIPKAFNVLKSELFTKNHAERLMKLASNTELGDLKAFCSKMDKEIPEISKLVKEGLADDNNREYVVRLQHRALEAPLDHMASFLRYADTEMPSVSKKIKNWLLEKENQNVLTARVLRTGIKNMRGFLNYAECAMPELVRKIRAKQAQSIRSSS